LEGDWAGYHVITAPLPSSGGIALLSMLAMKADLAASFAGLPLNSPQYVHLLAEIEKRVFADRASYFGDPDFYPAPVAQLLDPVYLARRAAEVDLRRPTPTGEVKPGLGEHHDTTHFSIIDRWGNAVSNTYTLNDDFGSGAVVGGAGFLLNNEMDDFSAKPGTPNIYGVVGGDANAIGPGKRPLSTMTPTILTEHGRAAIAVGSDGVSAISDPRGRGVARVLPASAERDRRPRFSASPARPPGQRTAATKPAPGCAPRRSPPGIPRP